MTKSREELPVYLEIGQKRTFACAPDWPGWFRSGRNEGLALRELFEYGPRYAKVLGKTGLHFRQPADRSALSVIERLEGNATTDFGAPDIALATDALKIDTSELEHLKAILIAGWGAFDAAANRAEGKHLRLGPRGGGRTLEQIIQHVLDANAAYLSRISRRINRVESATLKEATGDMRTAVLEALVAEAGGEAPLYGPRGGKRWPLRFFVRRSAWHVLDHAWEIEDRTT
jgi:hypothetical protein